MIEAVEARVQQLLHEGGQKVDASFGVATDQQGEVVFAGRRLLVTPRDEEWQRYAEVLGRAGLPYLADDEALGTEEVVVGEIPRDARTLPQIMRSRQPEHGLTSLDIFRMLGQTIRKVEDAAQLAPSPEDLSIDRVLILRNQARIMLVPPLHFESVSEQVNYDIANHIDEQLIPVFNRFGALLLSGAFQEGLEP